MYKNLIKKYIYLYWDDIKKYYGNGKYVPTKMYTEGVLFDIKKDFFIIKEPETLNLEKIKNHPDKKPKFMIIPKVLINEIKQIK